MSKNEIIQKYQAAKTIAELESIKGEIWNDYKRLLSYDQKMVYEVFKNKVIELECMN